MPVIKLTLLSRRFGPETEIGNSCSRSHFSSYEKKVQDTDTAFTRQDIFQSVKVEESRAGVFVVCTYIPYTDASSFSTSTLHTQIPRTFVLLSLPQVGILL
jgi:hypothetical protein